jgi:hypothetical protein
MITYCVPAVQVDGLVERTSVGPSLGGEIAAGSLLETRDLLYTRCSQCYYDRLMLKAVSSGRLPTVQSTVLMTTLCGRSESDLIAV